MVSISIYYVALANVTYKTLPEALRTDGASLFQFLRTVGTGVSVAVFITLFNRYSIINYENLRNNIDYSNLGLFNFMLMEGFRENSFSALHNMLEMHSIMQSIIADFFLLSISPIFFLPFLFLFYKKTSKV